MQTKEKRFNFDLKKAFIRICCFDDIIYDAYLASAFNLQEFYAGVVCI